MPIVSDPDAISYVIVVRGLSEAGYDIFCGQFPQHRGGVNPRLSETYLSVESELADVRSNLDWIVEKLATRYRAIELAIAIHAPRNWSNYDIPPEVVSAAQNGAISLRVMFSSPVASRSGAPA